MRRIGMGLVGPGFVGGSSRRRRAASRVRRRGRSGRCRRSLGAGQGAGARRVQGRTAASMRSLPIRRCTSSTTPHPISCTTGSSVRRSRMASTSSPRSRWPRRPTRRGRSGLRHGMPASYTRSRSTIAAIRWCSRRAPWSRRARLVAAALRAWCLPAGLAAQADGLLVASRTRQGRRQFGGCGHRVALVRSDAACDGSPHRVGTGRSARPSSRFVTSLARRAKHSRRQGTRGESRSTCAARIWRRSSCGSKAA